MLHGLTYATLWWMVIGCVLITGSNMLLYSFTHGVLLYEFTESMCIFLNYIGTPNCLCELLCVCVCVKVEVEKC